MIFFFGILEGHLGGICVLIKSFYVLYIINTRIGWWNFLVAEIGDVKVEKGNFAPHFSWSNFWVTSHEFSSQFW